MADEELSQLLSQHGVDDKTAQQLQNNINGADLINLVNSLKLSNSQLAIQQSNKILNRYGVSIHEGTMKKDLNYLYALYTGANNKEHTEEAIDYLVPITESDKSEDHLLAMEGFNYFTSLDSKLSEQLIDWLEQNKVEFLTNGEGHFHIKCEDRDHAYKVGRTISGIVRKKHLVRDSSNPGDNFVKEQDKNSKSYINSLKRKMDDIKPRDPNAELVKRLNGKLGGSMDMERKAKQNDRYGRNAKHKAKAWNEQIDYKIGENVLVNDCEATIKIPHGPDGTVGVIMDGKLSMVEYDAVTKLNEHILGIQPINPLFRLRELAGLPPAPASSVKPPIVDRPLDIDDDSPDDFSSMDGPEDPEMEIDTDQPIVAHLPASTPTMGGVPGDLPPLDANPEIPMGSSVPMASPAMSAIEDHLNNIQQQLASITLGEYKSLVHKLQDLTNQIQVMGRDYLGEQRRRK